MKSKKLLAAALAGLTAALWLSGIIPKQIAKIYGAYYIQKHFPEMQLECTGAEYSGAHGEYLLAFKSRNGKTYGFVTGPRYLPVFLGQGLLSIESDYREYYQ